jgi:hypothetical protein
MSELKRNEILFNTKFLNMKRRAREIADIKGGNRHGELFMGRPCKERADDLLKLSRHQLKLVVVILTGPAPVRGHLCTYGPV